MFRPAPITMWTARRSVPSTSNRTKLTSCEDINENRWRRNSTRLSEILLQTALTSLLSDMKEIMFVTPSWWLMQLDGRNFRWGIINWIKNWDCRPILLQPFTWNESTDWTCYNYTFYNCTNAFFNYNFRLNNCTKCDQLHTNVCPEKSTYKFDSVIFRF